MTQSLRQMSPIFPSHLSPFLLIPHLTSQEEASSLFLYAPIPPPLLLTALCVDFHSTRPLTPTLPPSLLGQSLRFSFFSGCKCAKNSPGSKSPTVLVSLAVTTSCHKVGGLKQQKCVLSQFWRSESEIKASAGPFSLQKL